MKLAGLNIDRFGARSQFNLSDIAEKLNVIYGPNGSGKTTTIQFIRWMLFGQPDEMSRRYLGGSPARGSIAVLDQHGARTLRRTAQTGSMLSQLTVESGSGYTGTPTVTDSPLQITNSEFDRFFTITFDQPRNIVDLFNAAASSGFQLKQDQRQLDRIQRISEEIAQHRSELSGFGFISGTSDSLRMRREEKRKEIDAVRADHQRRQQELHQRRHEIASEVAEQQSLVTRLRSVVANIDSAIDTRTKQLTEEYRQWMAARQESLDRRNQRAAEIDAQIAHWQQILTDVRQRLDQVRAQMTSFGEVEISATQTADMHFFLRTLGFRIRDIEQDVTGVYDNETRHDHEADANYLRGLMGSALNSMRDDVTRLCKTVEQYQHANDLSECREEFGYLSRVEKELSELISTYNRQRQQLGNDDTSFLPPNLLTESQTALSDRNALELAAALNDFRLRHLAERRESALSRSNEAELGFTNRQRALREIEAEIARFDESGRIPVLEREIIEIDEMIRKLEQRHIVEQRIASLEEEVRRLRENVGTSEIIDEACGFLRTLTDNDYSGVRLGDSYRCEVIRNRDGFVQDYAQLSRGAQDQVYLSVSLAIVAAYRRKHVEAPLILNDVFGNLDQTGTQLLADLLVNFVNRGQQTLVFTRHAHVRELFEPREARVFTLIEANRFEPQPAAPVLPRIVSQPMYVAPAPSPVVDDFVVDELPPTSPDPTYRWVAEWQRSKPAIIPTTPEPLPAPMPEPRPIVPAPRPQRSDESPSEDEQPPESSLSLTSPLSVIPTIAEELVVYLAELDLFTAGDLVDVDPKSVESSLGKHGITAEIIQRRQREVLMLVYLGITPLEAQLLVASGVPDPDRLSRADDSVLLKRIETILERPQAAQRFGDSSQYTVARIRRWIDLARRSNYRGRSRRSYFSSSESGSTGSSRSSRSSLSKRSSTRASSSNRTRKRSRDTGEEADTPARNTVRMKPKSQSGLRFYLELNDPVVDAPSIGPKTAEKLNALDIYTVAQLLDANPEWIATQLDDRRISIDDVTQWQLQAQLVCRIPNLRGHDAQILVACGVEDPTTLASLQPSTFLKQVSRYVNSKEGQRIIRNSKKPDLAEVTAWIEWSESARQLKAA